MSFSVDILCEIMHCHFTQNLTSEFLRCARALNDDCGASNDHHTEWAVGYLKRFKFSYIGHKTYGELMALGAGRRGNGDEGLIRCGGCRMAIHPVDGNERYPVHRVGGTANKFQFEYAFHDDQCLNLRKYKEAIRGYVFESELSRSRPKRASPLIRGETRILELFRERDLVLAVDDSLELPRPSMAGSNRNESGSSVLSESMVKLRRRRKLAMHHLFRESIDEYREIDSRFNDDEQRHDKLAEFAVMTKENNLIDEEFESENHRILKYVDFEVHGVSLWSFCMAELEMKDRASLWTVCSLIMSKMSTASAIRLLHRSKAHLMRFDVARLKTLCLSVIETATFPPHTALYLSAFLEDLSRENASRREEMDEFVALLSGICQDLLGQIESDHLLAIMIETPSDILGGLSIIEIAIDYEMVDFLDWSRFKAVFETMWSEFEYLDPSRPFQRRRAALWQHLELLCDRPSCFYFCPLGQFMISVLFYLLYLVTFSRHLTSWRYLWHRMSCWEWTLWIFNGGHILYEITEIAFKKWAYFGDLWNYWDLSIAANWTAIAALRFVYCHFDDGYTVKEEGTDVVDERATRDTALCQIYIALYSAQCIAIWTRFISTLQRTASLGPLIQMILEMLSDTVRFAVLLAAVMVGFAFAVHYVVGGDISEHSGADQDLSSMLGVGLFMFQALLGQHEWDLIRPHPEGVGEGRFVRECVLPYKS